MLIICENREIKKKRTFKYMNALDISIYIFIMTIKVFTHAYINGCIFKRYICLTYYKKQIKKSNNFHISKQIL